MDSRRLNRLIRMCPPGSRTASYSNWQTVVGESWAYAVRWQTPECRVVCRVSDAWPCRRSQVHGARRPKAAKERTRGRWCAEGGAPGYGDFANAEGACEGAQCVWSRAMT